MTGAPEKTDDGGALAKLVREIEELLPDVTPGPWSLLIGQNGHLCLRTADDVEDISGPIYKDADAEFLMLLSPENVRLLLSERSKGRAE